MMKDLAVILFLLAVWSRVLVTRGEDEKDIVLQYQVIGLVKHEDKPIEWERDFEIPVSELSIRTRSNVEHQYREALYSISINPENLYTVLWNKSNEAWADLSFYFRPDNYTKIEYWNRLIGKAVGKAVDSSYEKRDSLTHLAYRSFIQEPELIAGGENTVYKTSYEITFELDLDVDEMTEEWQNTSSSIYIQKCKEVNNDLQSVFAEGDLFIPDTFKCVFYESEDTIKAITTVNIAFNSIYNTDIYNDIDKLKDDLFEFFECLVDYHEIILCVVEIIIDHTTPLIYPQPATTTSAHEPTTFTTTEETSIASTFDPDTTESESTALEMTQEPIPTEPLSTTTEIRMPTIPFLPFFPSKAPSMRGNNFITIWIGVATSIAVFYRLN